MQRVDTMPRVSTKPRSSAERRELARRVARARREEPPRSPEIVSVATRSIAVAAAAVAAVGAAGAWLWTQREPSPQEQWALLDRYCVTCHNDVELAGDLGFDRLTVENLHADAEVWETVIRKIRGHLMPPPRRAAARSRAARVVRGLARVARSTRPRPSDPNPGAPSLHRLNRAEYANAVRDLIDLPVNGAALLPGDDSSGGFDNIANALSVSPALMQAYVSAAAKVSRLAIGDPTRDLRDRAPTARRAACSSPTTSKASRSARAAACSSSTCFRSTRNTRSASAARAAASGSRPSAATRTSRSR